MGILIEEVGLDGGQAVTRGRDTLRLHEVTNSPYYLGIFLTGAYQDIMGDLHNLFGRVNEVHVFLDEDDERGYYIEETLPGNTVAEVLAMTQYFPNNLAQKMKSQIDQAINQLGKGTFSKAIVVRGPSVMTGYYADDEATRSALRNGWFHTGDIGYLDDDGDLWILNRRSDLIVSGGENIYPAEVERVLRSHPQVAEVCVVGLPHADWGQQVAALVQLDRPGAIDGDELLDYCRKSLAGYKQPRLLVFTDEIPTTGSGKIHRHAVEELLANSMGQP